MVKVLSISRTPSDFVAGTRHLSIEDRGAYQEILDQIVILGQDETPPSLPDDDGFLARLMGWPVPKWRSCKARLCKGTGAVLVSAHGRISQSRIVEEIENAKTRIDGASAAGRASGEARRRKSATLGDRLANGRSTDVPTPVQHPLNGRTNGSRTDRERKGQRIANGSRTEGATDREPVISHKSEVIRLEEVSTSSSVVRKGKSDDAVSESDLAFLREALQTLAPSIKVSDTELAEMITTYGADAIAVLLAEKRDYLAGKRVGYLRKAMASRIADGWSNNLSVADTRSFVNHAIGMARRAVSQ